MNKLFESKITVIATYKENLDNEIQAIPTSQNTKYSNTETFQIHVTSKNYDLVSMSEDLESWEELENKGKDIIVEKTVTQNGSYTYYF